MKRFGFIVNGDPTVLAEGEPIARKTDVVDHGGRLGEGCETVLGSYDNPIVRVQDRFLCSMVEEQPHHGGYVMKGADSVIVGGRPAARRGDLTGCLGDDIGPGELAGVGDGEGGLSAAEAISCRALWLAYEAQAMGVIAPAGDDHRHRNHLINGAYANLYLKNPNFAWAGLAAYASKQVGCAMDHCQKVKGIAPGGGPLGVPSFAMADYLHDQLGKGNQHLFLDVYPLHLFYAEHGFDRLKECARERVPPVPAAALDAFKALDRYEKSGDPEDLKEHVRALAVHEQIELLQKGLYDDAWTRRILDLNEGNLDDAAGVEGSLEIPGPLGTLGGALPAEVIFSSGCDARGHVAIPFKNDKRKGNLYDVPQRMEWILVDITDHYMRNIGSKAHKDDLETLRTIAEDKGAKF
ncbi:MAG: PAAR domain-containing protein [Myxococcales bacterium]|nr:PAAR domain-containing protein [Myxococcales bacterium]